MKIDRRSLLKSATVASGIIAVPAAVRAFQKPAFVIFDSRSIESSAFAYGQAVSRIDVAQEDVQMWRSLRAIGKGRIEGLTGWSDWVVVRGLLEENGLRVKTETKAGKLFRWTMA